MPCEHLRSCLSIPEEKARVATTEVSNAWMASSRWLDRLCCSSDINNQVCAAMLSYLTLHQTRKASVAKRFHFCRAHATHANVKTATTRCARSKWQLPSHGRPRSMSTARLLEPQGCVRSCFPMQKLRLHLSCIFEQRHTKSNLLEYLRTGQTALKPATQHALL